jgi:hypothetical protein
LKAAVAVGSVAALPLAVFAASRARLESFGR